MSYPVGMHRPGADPLNMQIEDFLCDYCHRAWDGAFPMVEGHQGHLICGNCMTLAYRAISSDPAEGPLPACAMCLEERTGEPHWRSPVDESKVVCKRCVKQAAGALSKDAESGWKRPE